MIKSSRNMRNMSFSTYSLPLVSKSTERTFRLEMATQLPDLERKFAALSLDMPPHLPRDNEESDLQFSPASNREHYENSGPESDLESFRDLALRIRNAKLSTLRALCDELYKDMSIQRTLIKLHETKFKSSKTFKMHSDQTVEQWYITADFIRHVEEKGDAMDEDELDDNLAKVFVAERFASFNSFLCSMSTR
ncbi:hypothetical protein BU16DRAFT_233991 [Lophium mytilinum]|uniref:Uncharacterized protein n=1 Tax=Lophium mytilinum TaxID=390894 RepID=A0A6A6R610_9PEZI|nr:hypothetical protein BU16DRAFT_233991 [Lophium mytilinum]